MSLVHYGKHFPELFGRLLSGEEVRIRAWKNLSSSTWLVNVICPLDNHRKRNGLITSCSNLPHPVPEGPHWACKIFLHMYRCAWTWRKRDPKKSCVPTKLLHSPPLHTQTTRSQWKEDWDLRRPNWVWQPTALLKKAPLQPNTAVIVNVRQN